MFRKLTKEQVKPLNGLDKVREWIESHGLKRAAVTNAPRPNAELMISLLGLSDFFHAVIIGRECEHSKPMHACTGPMHWKLAAFIKNPNHFVAAAIVVRISWASQ
ncbi:Haloacid dehalogenase-like hydrolase domain-containing protein Sgpp [Arachis hypogaea]|nr:Haloacid dehalogenase-like hydrolase domain-containing protein Sgpp [Arachis hypogaea]